MPLFVLYLYKASSYLAICRNDCHLQIGCYQAHAIGSCFERLTRKMDVCTVRVRYSVPTREGSQRASAADLIAERINTDIAALFVHAWAMYFDGSACGDGCGIGILLVSPRGVAYSFSIGLPTPCTNNLAEYEAVRKGMKLLLEARAEAVEIFGIQSW
jgi:hypothetical protein